MRVVRSALAIIGGFAVTAILAAGLTLLVAFLLGVVRSNAPGAAFWAGALAAAMISATAGGYVATAFAPARPFVHTLALAVIILALGVRSVLYPQGNDPLWYTGSLAVLGPLFVLAGGHVRYARDQRSLSAGAPTS